MPNVHTHRRAVLRGGLGLAVTGLAAALVGQPALAASPLVTVYKDPNCGCCNAWIAHLRDHGFTVTAQNRVDMAAVKDRFALPVQMRSCHTATIDGYVIEGHVPAADIQRLLATKPNALGLAVPGMPVGSPGMEMGGRRDSYRTWLIAPERVQVFARHPSSEA